VLIQKKSYARFLKDFYTAPNGSVFYTFYDKKMYWCTVGEPLADNSHIEYPLARYIKQLVDQNRDIQDSCLSKYVRLRQTVIPWRSVNLKECALEMRKLPGLLTCTDSTRNTMAQCIDGKGDHEQRLTCLNMVINGEISEARQAIQNSEPPSDDTLRQHLPGLISSLGPNDLEVLVHLCIEAREHYVLSSQLGRSQKTMDMVYLYKRLSKGKIESLYDKARYVQVKAASATQKTLKDWRNKAKHVVDEGTCELMFVTTSNNVKGTEGVTLIQLKELTDWVIDAGLTQWVTDKCW
jgi:hypothetical protein